MKTKFIGQVLAAETTASLIMMMTCACAIIIANSSFAESFNRLLANHLLIQLGSIVLDYSMYHWINDFLMALFFLQVALEIKRELICGELSERSQMYTPLLSAIGGMVVPAAIYLLCNFSNQQYLSGWAIPAATDIAFAIGIMNLLGNRVPQSLKIFLMAVAIFDDLGAIIIIATFYKQQLSIEYLLYAVLLIGILCALNSLQVTKLTAYMIVGLILWYVTLKSGIHATLSGVILGLIIPLSEDKSPPSPLHSLELMLLPWVKYFILPLFALANSGLSFANLSPNAFISPVFLGVTLGLFFGKQIGIFSVTYILIKCGLYKLPAQVRLLDFWGMSILCGIGFTMSLFIGHLAFNDDMLMDEVRISVLVGSLISAIVGYLILAKKKI
jgi:NhaA family Na+:H+ antiporter